MRHYTRQTIKRNFFAALLLAPFIPVLLALGTGGYLFWNHVQQARLDRLALHAAHHVATLDGFLEDCLGDLSLIEGQLTVGSDSDALWAALERLKLKHRDVVDLALVDQDGSVQAYAGPKVYRGTHVQLGPWLKEALERGDSVGGIMSGQLGLPHFVLARRLDTFPRAAVLRMSLSPEAFSRILMANRVKGVEIFLASQDGEFVAGSGARASTPGNDLISPVFSDRIGMAFRDSESNAVFASGIVRHGGWILVARESDPTILGATQSAFLFVGVSALFGGIVVFLSSLYLTGYVERMLRLRDEERETLREQLYRAGRLAELGEMAAGFAHEINNPLQIMKSDQAYMEMLLDDFRKKAADDPNFLKDVDEVISSLTQIRLQIDRCARITHSILNFGRAGSAEEQNVDLAKFVPEVLTMVNNKMRLNNISLNLDMPASRLLVHVDPGRLQQVLLNLLNNAIYAVSEVGDGREAKIDVACNPEGRDKVRIAITDNGVGIDPDRKSVV